MFNLADPTFITVVSRVGRSSVRRMRQTKIIVQRVHVRKVKDPLICIDEGVVIKFGRLDWVVGRAKNQSQNPAIFVGTGRRDFEHITLDL